MPTTGELVNGNQIYFHPTVKANQGNYFVIIENCIEVGSGESYQEICVPSQPFTVTIKDPCLLTDVIEFGFPAGFKVQVPVLQTRSFSIPQEILSNPFAQFPMA